MKADELRQKVIAAWTAGVVTEKVNDLIRSYGLACALAERERCAVAAVTQYRSAVTVSVNGAIKKITAEEMHREAAHTCASSIALVIRSRPTGDELLKEIEG